MASVTISSYKESTELSEGDCTTLYIEISDELEEKFLEFQYTEDTDIRQQCDDLNNYINTQREAYKKCEKHYISNHYINIDKGIKDLSAKYNKYIKCSTESTSSGKEDDKSESETKDSCKDQKECAKEQVLQEDKKSQSGCKKESSHPGCLQQEELLDLNGNHSSLSDQTNAEQQAVVALTASALDDTQEPNSPRDNSAAIGVLAPPTSPSQDKLNPSSDTEVNNLSHDIYDNKQYVISLVHDENSYNSINGYEYSNGNISDNIIIKLLKKTSPERKYRRRIYESVNRRTPEGVDASKNSQDTHHSEVSKDTENSYHHHTSVQNVSPVPEMLLKIESPDDEEKSDGRFLDISGHTLDHKHLNTQEKEAHRQDSHSQGLTYGHTSTEGVRLQLTDAPTGEISLTEYIKFTITFLGTIILFLFLLKFTPLKFIFNKRKKKRRRKRKERLKRILSGPTHAENDIYMLYSPFQYYQWEEPP